MASGGERSKYIQEVVRSLQHCSELKEWGMIVESSEEYLKVSRKLNQLASPECDIFSPEEKSLLVRVAAVLQQTGKSLQDLSSVQESSLTASTNIKQILTALEALMDGSQNVGSIESALKDVLPPDVVGVAGRGEQDRSLVLAEDEYSKVAQGKSGSLLASRDMLLGFSYLTIAIEKIGIKDPHNYLDPYITVSLKSFHGDDVEEPQDTPVASQRETSQISFNVTVLVKTPLEEVPDRAAIFFEFKHYKPKKKSVSTKCFSFMEMDEVRPGKAALEIYKKPTDFRRKKLSLLSVKPLYLQLTLTVDKPT